MPQGDPPREAQIRNTQKTSLALLQYTDQNSMIAKGNIGY